MKTKTESSIIFNFLTWVTLKLKNGNSLYKYKINKNILKKRGGETAVPPEDRERSKDRERAKELKGERNGEGRNQGTQQDREREKGC